MVATGLPLIHLPGSEKFVSYKNSLQDYCSKSKVELPKYMAEKIDGGLMGTVSFGSNYVKCTTVSITVKEADARVAYEALTQLGYLNGKEFVPLERKSPKRRENSSMEADSAKHIPPGTFNPITAKAHLHQICQQHKLGNPAYNTVVVPSNQGHGKGFFSTVTVGTTSFKSLSIHQKSKNAEQDAAQVALNAAKLLLEAGAAPLTNTNKDDTGKKKTVSKQPVSMKNRLQEHFQKNGLDFPTYEVVHNERGKTYSATVVVCGVQYSGCSYPSKKAAEASAAEVAMISLGILQS